MVRTERIGSLRRLLRPAQSLYRITLHRNRICTVKPALDNVLNSRGSGSILARCQQVRNSKAECHVER